MSSSYVPELPRDILIDTGVLYCDLETPGTMVKFGGTRGGLTFNRNREIRSVPFDGASGENEGLHRFTDGVPSIDGTTILFASPSRLGVLEPGSTQESTGTEPTAVLTVTPLPYRTMFPASAYHIWECIWKRGNGGTFKVTFPKGYAQITSLGAQDNNEGESPISVKAVNATADIVGTDEVPAPYRYEVTGDDIEGGYYSGYGS